MPTAFGLVVLAHCLDYCRIGAKRKISRPYVNTEGVLLNYIDIFTPFLMSGKIVHGYRGHGIELEEF